ncbi:MAG: 4'-phosphopantetheinyl transferase superfamily protein [Methylococcaceae bacterium]|nr:4'-phosphopantetheinyl transferase superfamily protein [Methylococcaceae bacterium]
MRLPCAFRLPRSDLENVELSSGLIHVWDGIGPIDPARFRDFYTILDDTEQQRANGFHFEQHRIGFVSCRGWLRLLLSAYTGRHPGEIKFTSSEYGKPRLNEYPPNTGLVFNVSHSRERMAFAFGLDCMLGVDIEQTRNISDLEAMVDRICSETEKSTWRKIPKDRQLDYFFSIWVRKEAIIKAHGQGISLGMHDCELANNLDHPLSLPDSCGKVEDWTLFNLSYAEGYQGAVAVNSAHSSMVRRALPEQKLFDLYLSGKLG